MRDFSSVAKTALMELYPSSLKNTVNPYIDFFIVVLNHLELEL